MLGNIVPREALWFICLSKAKGEFGRMLLRTMQNRIKARSSYVLSIVFFQMLFLPLAFGMRMIRSLCLRLTRHKFHGY